MKSGLINSLLIGQYVSCSRGVSQKLKDIKLE